MRMNGLFCRVVIKPTLVYLCSVLTYLIFAGAPTPG